MCYYTGYNCMILCLWVCLNLLFSILCAEKTRSSSSFNPWTPCSVQEKVLFTKSSRVVTFGTTCSVIVSAKPCINLDIHIAQLSFASICIICMLAYLQNPDMIQCVGQIHIICTSFKHPETFALASARQWSISVLNFWNEWIDMEKIITITFSFAIKAFQEHYLLKQ